MVTWAQNLARPDRAWAVCVKIEGLGHYLDDTDAALAGDADGCTRFWTQLPDYVASTAAPYSTINRAMLGNFPDLMSERAEALGGFPELGELSFELVDEDDYLTGQLSTERQPVTYSSFDLSAVTGTIAVGSVADLSANTVLWIGSEALRVDSVGMSTISVTRGWLGTDAVTHGLGDRIFATTPFLRNRRATVKIVPIDGALTEEREVGTYVIDSVSWDEGLNAWQFSGRSLLKHLHRAAPIATRTARVVGVTSDDDSSVDLTVEPVGRSSLSQYQLWTGTEADESNGFYLKNGAEILTVKASTLANGVKLGRRGVLGTAQEEIKVGTLLRQVFVAERDAAGDFRYSPGGSPSEDRGSGTWIKTAHWVDLCLIIMTSSASEADGLELVNYTGSNGNYSILPPGYGLGLPADQIDWASWRALKARTLDYEFPNFVYGDEQTSFAELISRHFLRPIGAYLSGQSGLVKVVLPRIPIVGSASVALGTDEILMKQVGKGRYEPRMKASLNVASHTGSIVYEIGPARERLTVSSQDYADTYGQRGYYLDADKPITIEVPSGQSYHSATQATMARAGQRRLFRWHRPPVSLDVDADSTLWESAYPGDLLSATIPELPNLATGTRGWTAVAVEVLEREDVCDPKDGVYLKLKVDAYGQNARAAKVAPSALIASVSTNDATVTANRYTHTDSDDVPGLPDADAEGFVTGDKVRLVNLDGSSAAAGTQTISGIAGNVISLNGDFSGSLASGKLLVYCDYSNATATQTASFAFMANKATNVIDGTSTGPWIFGEP